jgi:hypothetical protein
VFAREKTKMMSQGLQYFARCALQLAAVLVVAACGSGAVGPPPVNDPGTITVLPTQVGDCADPFFAQCTPVIAYSGLPTTFSITGGTGSYIVTSSNQAIIQQSGNTSGTLTVIPNPVVVPTPLIITARDTGSAAPVSVTVIVRPGTVSNTVTITPSSAACSPAICSGGDAVIASTISQGGIPLPARGVRFDVISGDIRFVTSAVGLPETLGLSVTTNTDEAGVARARLRALDTAQNQTAIIQITDLGSGAYQRTTVIIARATATEAGFFTVPTSITYTGPNTATCASGISSEVFVFGGTPPYTISNSAPGAFSTNTSVVGSSGGSFRISPNGVCATNATFAVTDASSRTVTVAVSNQPGTTPVPAAAAFTVSPTSVTLASCTEAASVIAVGGSGAYNANSSSSSLLAIVSGNLVTIRRTPGTNPNGITSFQVAVTDGRTIQSVSVGLTGAAAAACP